MSKLKKTVNIWLNIYDLVEGAEKNVEGLLGAFHSGCEIDGCEYSFGATTSHRQPPVCSCVCLCVPVCACVCVCVPVCVCEGWVDAQGAAVSFVCVKGREVPCV